MFKIGLIDDDPREIRKVKRTIKVNAPKNTPFDFKIYDIGENINELIKSLTDKIIEDIKKNEISSLIIDYKIMIEATKIEGTDIFDEIHDLVPEFPVIILTDVIEDCIKHDFIDPDKVYKKSSYFKLENDYSIDKTKNIFRNMERYLMRRDILQSKLESAKKELVEKGNEQEIFDELIEIENKLDDFVPIDQSEIEKAIDSKRLKEVVDLLEQADKILEK